MAVKKNGLTPVVPGFYMDGKGSMYLNMREFLCVNGMADNPAVRAVVWHEIHDIFGEAEVIEISDC